MRIRLLWGVLAVATGIGWTSWAGGVPALVVGTYWAAWAWGVVLPGVLVHRAVRGRPSTIVGDVGLGACVGLVLQLAAWAVMTTLGLQHQLLWWPVLVVLVFVAVPRLRRHFSLRHYEHRVPTGAAALGMLAFLLALLGVTRTFRYTSLPPSALSWYQDDLWNLGNVAELMRTAAPQVAQVAGRPFYYHWFSDAHLAAMSLTTSIDPVLVVGRLWTPPLLLLIAGALMAVGQRLSGSAWVGAGAVVLFVFAPSIDISWFGLAGAAPDIINSPSQLFAVPLLLVAIDLIVSILRGSRLVGTWIMLAAVLVGCAGAKSSVLPVLAGGLFLVALAALLVARDRVRVALSTLVLSAVTVLLTRSVLAGGESGSGLQLFAVLSAAKPWQLVQGGHANTFPSGVVIPGLGVPGAGRVLLLVLACYGVSYLWVLAGVPALRRDDLTGWLLLGIGLAGVAGLMAIRHPAYSEAYFLRIAIVAWQLLALWGYQRTVATARDRAGARPTAWSAIAGAALGVLLLTLARLAGGPIPTVPPTSALTASLQRSLLVPAIVMVAFLVLLLARGRPSRKVRALTVTGFATAALAAALALPAQSVLASFGIGNVAGTLVALGVAVSLATLTWSPHRARQAVVAVLVVVCLVVVVTQSVVVRRPVAVPLAASRIVTADEVAAARWLGQNAGQYDIIATNVHCLPIRTTPHCDARAFWVSGLTGRRVLIEGWGYTDAAQGAHGGDGLGFSRQLFDDRALFALNEGIFTDPTPEKARKLYALGVRWLFADRRAGPVSADLAAVASPQFRSGPVTVYRLTSPRPAVTTG